MLLTKSDIIAKAWLVQEIVNLVMHNDKTPISVDKILLIGSYARGEENIMSDLDLLVQLRGCKTPYPTWDQMEEVKHKINNPRIHVIYGTEEAQKSLHEKYNRPYQRLDLGGQSAHSSAPSA